MEPRLLISWSPRSELNFSSRGVKQLNLVSSFIKIIDIFPTLPYGRARDSSAKEALSAVLTPSDVLLLC